MVLTFHRLVQHDLRAVLRYYEEEGGRALADRFFEEADSMVLRIEREPGTFHPLAEGLRRANFPSFPYHFLFRENSGIIRVLVLRHHRRHPAYGLTRR